MCSPCRTEPVFDDWMAADAGTGYPSNSATYAQADLSPSARTRVPILPWRPDRSDVCVGTFCPIGSSASLPANFRGRYFFADFVNDWIEVLDPVHPEMVETFATGLARPVDLDFVPDGSLYVLPPARRVVDRCELSPGHGVAIASTSERDASARSVMLNRGVAGFREWHRTTEPGPTDSGVSRTSGRSPDRAGSYGRVAGQLGRGLQIQGFVGPLGGRRTEPARTGLRGGSTGQSRGLREGRRTTGPCLQILGFVGPLGGRRAEPAPTGGSADNGAGAYRFRGSSDLWSPDRAGSYGRVAGQQGLGLQIQGFVGPLGGRRAEPAPTGGSADNRAGASGLLGG